LKILITGAFGNVGLYTLKNLLSKGHKVRVLELKNKNNLKIFDDLQKKNGYSIDMVWGDITDVLSVSKAVKGQDIIIHQAFIIPALSEQKPNWAWEINVEGTRNLLRAAAEEEVKTKIVFTSSVSVFGETQDQKPPRKIEDQVKPTDNYSHHKVACEQLVKISGLKWTILRLGAVLSPSLCEIDPMLFSVSLDNRIELVHAADAGSALANAAVSDQVWGKTLLIGGGKRCQMLQKDFITRVLDEVGLGMFPEDAFTSKPFYTDWMDTSESQHLLKYQEKDLDDFLIEIRKVLGIRRYLLRAVKPIVKYWILKKSPYFPIKRSAKAKAKPGIKNSPVSAIQ
jgi:nucleoside-diphosphate-sugar epimerase